MQEKPLRIVVVEDDHFWREDTATTLQTHLRATVTSFSAESQFREFLDKLGVTPDIVVMGLWVKWSHPAPIMTEPPVEVLEGEYSHHFGAGMRMARLIANDPRTEKIPVVIWDDFDLEDMKAPFQGDIPQNVYFRNRTSRVSIAEDIRNILKARSGEVKSNQSN